MLPIILLPAILLSVLSVTTESNKHKNSTGAAEARLIPEHEERSSRSYPLMYHNQISQYPSSQLFGSGGYSNNLYYSPTQERGAGFTDSRTSDISSIYRFLYPDQNQQVYSSRLPVQTWNTQSDTKVQASTKESPIPIDESKTGEIKPTNRLLNPSQNRQGLPLHSGRAQNETNLIIQASTADLKKEFKEQQINTTTRLLNSGENQQELSVHSGRAQSKTNPILQTSTEDSKKEFKEQQIKPTTRLLNSGQNQQELPVHSGRAQSKTNPILQTSTEDSKKEFKEQQIKPTTRLLNSDELSVQTVKFKSETNVQESANDRTPKDEPRIHQNKHKNKTNKYQIKNDEIKKQKGKLQHSENLKPKIIPVTNNNLPDTKPSSTLSENNSPTKVETSFLDQKPTTIKPQSSTSNVILSAPTKKPFRKHHKKHQKDDNLIDEIFYSFFSSEEI